MVEENITTNGIMSAGASPSVAAATEVKPMSIAIERSAVSERKSILSFFEETARLLPSRVAVRAGERTTSYRELDAQANAVARTVVEHTGGNNTVVGVLGASSPEVLAAFLGIWKAGCAYLPLDPESPAGRLAYMVENAGCDLVLRANDVVSTDLEGVREIALGREWTTHGSSDAPTFEPASSDLAYVMYTSGTTGAPKGVMIEHGSLVNRLVWMQRQYPIASEDRVLQKAALTFDVSVWELFWAAMVGAAMHVLPPGGRRDPAKILDALENGQVSVVHFVPSQLRTFTEYLSALPGPPRLAHLKYVFCSGEQLLRADCDALRRNWGARDRTPIINLYGPTEATIDVSHHELSEHDPARVPIGRAIDGMQLYVLGDDGKEVGTDEMGELCIGGIGVARGYINDAERTRTSFVPNPWRPGERIYRTGDLAKVLPDGELAFLGRRDGQVKVNGIRIEVAEVEAALLGSGLVSRAAVLARERRGQTHLIAYVVPDPRKAGRVRRLSQQMMIASGTAEAVELPNGLTFLCRNRSDAEYMAREIFDRRVYGTHLGSLPPQAIVFDVGANVGMFSVFASSLSENATVYSFEPVPQTFAILQKNCFVHGVSGKCLNLGLSHRAGAAVMTYYPNVASMSSYYASGEEESEAMRTFLHNRDRDETKRILTEEEVERLVANRLQSEQVETVTASLSQVIAAERVERIDLLKIDVEKAELDVLLGIEEHDWPRIDRILLEVHDFEGRLGMIQEILTRHGYETEMEQETDLEGTCMYSVFAYAAERVAKAGSTTARKTHPVEPRNEYGSYSRYVDDLRDHLRLQLPGYMVPSRLVVVEEIPLNGSGKADLGSLPTENLFLQKEDPRNRTETDLREIWSDLLGVEPESISIDDNFFLNGGDSLAAVSMVSMIIRKFAVEVSVDLLFEKPTIRAVAKRIGEGAARAMRADVEIA